MSMDKPSNHDDTLTRKILAYQDGALSQAEVRDLETELRSAPAKRQLFMRMVIDQTLVCEVLQERDMMMTKARDGRFSDSRDRHRRRWLLVGTAAVVGLALLGMWYPLFQTPHSHALARVTYAQEAQWEAAREIKVADALTAGPYKLVRGTLRFEMSDGTTVSMKAPVIFEVVNGSTLSLYGGSLGARIQDPETEFTVQTTTMNVIDLGTAFGVHVDAEGISTVAVFEGSVRLEQKNILLQEPVLQLYRGDVVQTDHNGMIQSIDLDPALFESLWPLTAGIDEVSDFITFLPPVGIRPLMDYRSNHKVFILPEKQDVILEDNLPIDFKLPLQLIAQGYEPRVDITKGRRVSSYLLFFCSEGPKSWSNPQEIAGEITFAQPVLGIIATDSRLTETDTLLGLPDVVYPETQGRGLKLGGKKLSGIPDDAIDLSLNRRRLSFRLHTGPQMDSLRVLVRAD